MKNNKEKFYFCNYGITFYLLLNEEELLLDLLNCSTHKNMNLDRFIIDSYFKIILNNVLR